MEPTEVRLLQAILCVRERVRNFREEKNCARENARDSVLSQTQQSFGEVES